MTTTATTTRTWAGGASPFGMSWHKLMMWWFIVTDALLFAGFLASYGFTRLGSEWPVVSDYFAIPLITVMTFVLISSSATMACAVAAARAGDRAKLTRFLGLTALGGVVFLGMQAFEWASFIGHGGRLHRTDELGLLGSYFFMITGFHGTHVLIGVIMLAVLFLKAKKGNFNANGIEVGGLYWHFVDLVWVFIFGCFYLI